MSPLENPELTQQKYIKMPKTHTVQRLQMSVGQCLRILDDNEHTTVWATEDGKDENEGKHLTMEHK